MPEWLTDSLIRKDRATQLLIKYKSGALVTQWQSNSSNVTKDYFWYRYEWEHQYTSSSLSNQKPEGKRPKTAPAADPKGEEVKVKTNSIKLKTRDFDLFFFCAWHKPELAVSGPENAFFYLTILRKHSLEIFFFQTADSMNIYWTFFLNYKCFQIVMDPMRALASLEFVSARGLDTADQGPSILANQVDARTIKRL